MDIVDWLLRGKVGIAHRSLALRAGFSVRDVRDAANSGAVRVIRRAWLALPLAAGEIVTAAEAGGRVACISAARKRGWWMPEGTDDRLHLHLHPHSRSTTVPAVVHWTTPVAPVAPTELVEAPESALAHVALCLSFEDALTVWESAVKIEPSLSVASLREVAWPNPATRRLAASVTDLADSGIETMFALRIVGWGLRVRQQVQLAGHPVDFLIGERLVVQLDGYAYHSSSAHRTRDVAHDAELRRLGYTVLRFTYSQIVHGWPDVEKTLSRILATGAHAA